MIRRQANKFIAVSCDSCGVVHKNTLSPTNSFRSSPFQFKPVWAAAQADGWRAKKDGKDWKHFCPDCGGEPVEANASPRPLAGADAV
jgi:predicted RNA-binding Zn-ribbon protein involved in translation (DUF1610 family)